MGPIALNQELPRPIPVAVVAVKEAGMSKRAFGPNTMPDGFIKYKLELPPVTWMRPLMIEASPPLMRLRIFWIDGEERKFAVWLGCKPNWVKLWKRLLPSEEV